MGNLPYSRKYAGEQGVFSAYPQLVRDEVALCLGYFALYMLVYMPVCVRQGLHWDEVFDVAGAANGTYVAAGRWGLALYRYLFGMGYIPWMSGVVAGLFIAAALVLQTRLFAIRTRFGAALYGFLYIGCVQWVNQLQYSHQSDAIGLSLLCVTASAYLFSERAGRSRCLASVLLIYACSVYQTSMLYLLVLLFVKMLVGDGKISFYARDFCSKLIWIIFAGCAYLVSQKISLMLPVLTETDLNYMRHVQHSMSKWTEIAAAPSLEERFTLLVLYAECYLKVVFKNALGLAYEGQWVYATTIIPLCYMLWRWGWRERSWQKVLLLLFIWLLPFAMILVVMTDQGPRVSLAEPLSCASMWMLWARQGVFSERVKPFVLFFALIVVLKGGYRVAVIAEDEKNLYASRIQNVLQLNARLLAAADAGNREVSEFIYFGQVPNVAPDVYRQRRAHRYDTSILLLLPDGRFPGEMTVPLRKANCAEVRAFGALVESMPQWPAPGCVATCGDTVLVKFGE